MPDIVVEGIPKPGAINTLSAWTTVTLTQFRFEPPWKKGERQRKAQRLASSTCRGPSWRHEEGFAEFSGTSKIGWPIVLSDRAHDVQQVPAESASICL